MNGKNTSVPHPYPGAPTLSLNHIQYNNHGDMNDMNGKNTSVLHPTPGPPTLSLNPIQYNNHGVFIHYPNMQSIVSVHTYNNFDQREGAEAAGALDFSTIKNYQELVNPNAIAEVIQKNSQPSTSEIIEDDLQQIPLKRLRLGNSISEPITTLTTNTNIRDSGIGNLDNTLYQNPVFNVLRKPYLGNIILAAYEFDQKNKGKPRKFVHFVGKLCKIIIENEFNEGRHDILRDRFLKLRQYILELFPNSGTLPKDWHLALVKSWPETAKALVKLSTDTKDVAVENFMKEIKDDDLKNNDLLQTLAFCLVPLLLQIPSGTTKPKKGEKISRQDILDILITEAQELENLDNEADFVKVQESVLKVYNRTHETIIQPYIVICGELKTTKSVYVVIKNSIKYKVDSVSTAFD